MVASTWQNGRPTVLRASFKHQRFEWLTRPFKPRDAECGVQYYTAGTMCFICDRTAFSVFIWYHKYHYAVSCLVILELADRLSLINDSTAHLYLKLSAEESCNVSVKGRAVSGTTVFVQQSAGDSVDILVNSYKGQS